MSQEEASLRQTDPVAERLERLELQLREQAGRIGFLEQQLNPQNKHAEIGDVSASPIRREASSSPEHANATRATSVPQPVIEDLPSKEVTVFPSPAARTTKAASTAQANGTSAASRKPRLRTSDLESRIGGGWLNRIGIVAIVFGVAFFLKYAFENEWIGPLGRVGVGIFLGVVLLLIGERLRRRSYASYGHGLSGGGILILYLAIFSAFSFYKLLDQIPAFVLMALITATAVVLAARANALPIAILGLAGGFLTPILLSTGTDNEAALFGYIVLLDLGVLALAYFKGWRILNYLAFYATWLMFAGWYLEWYKPEKLWTTLVFLFLFFAIFALVAISHNLIQGRPARWLDTSLVFSNATFFFGATYTLLAENHAGARGALALALSILYAALFFAAQKRQSDDERLALTFFAVAFTFLSLAIAIQFEQQWVTIGWALQGAVMTWVGLRGGSRLQRFFAFLILIVAAMHWFGVDVREFVASASSLPLLNRRAVSCLVLIGALLAAAHFYARADARRETPEYKSLAALLLVAANLLGVVLLSFETNDLFSRLQASAQEERATALYYSRQIALVCVWALYGAATLALGIVRDLKPLRLMALMLFALAALALVTFDASHRLFAGSQTIVFNETFAAYALLVGGSVWAIYFYEKAAKVDERERARVVPVLTVAAHLLAVIALSAEASGYFQAKMGGVDSASEEFRDWQLAAQLSLSVVWTTYGGALLIVGIVRRSQLLRLMALGLLGLTIAKVFIFDLAALERFYRIISFIVLGAILLAVSFLYQQRQRMAKAEAAPE